MDPGGIQGAFGGEKAGGQQDPLTFIKRPAVIIRILALLFSIIVFGCVSSTGWFYLLKEQKEVCVMNMDSSACHFSTFVGVIGFVAAIGFLVGEWFFEQMSSIKSRKHYVILDMAFSGVWAVFYAIAFIYMATAWSKNGGNLDIGNLFDFAKANVIGAIFFAFLSVFCWLGSVGLAYQRFKAGSNAAFSQGLGDEGGMGQDANQYQGYPGGPEDTGYNDPPFQGGGQAGMGYQQQQMQY